MWASTVIPIELIAIWNVLTTHTGLRKFVVADWQLFGNFLVAIAAVLTQAKEKHFLL